MVPPCDLTQPFLLVVRASRGAGGLLCSAIAAGAALEWIQKKTIPRNGRLIAATGCLAVVAELSLGAIPSSRQARFPWRGLVSLAG